MDNHPPNQPNPEPAPAADDEEYELEPLDPAIVAAEERHAREVAERARAAIDIDAVYRDADHNRGSEVVENWARNFKYRFHIKHVLVGTALLAIVVAIASLGYLVPAIFIFVLGSLLSLYFYLGWQDRKHQRAAYEKREELYAKRRERALSSPTSPPAMEPNSPGAPVVPATATIAAAETQQESLPPAPFRIQFSLRAMIIAMTVAAVTFGLIHALGGPDQTATILGLIAVGGLLVYAVGVEPPQAVTFGWWFILSLYVVLTIASAAWNGG